VPSHQARSGVDGSSRRLSVLVQFGRRCQLHGIIRPQTRDFRQPFGVGQQGKRDFQDVVLVSDPPLKAIPFNEA
jgi:hypothetical protein